MDSTYYVNNVIIYFLPKRIAPQQTDKENGVTEEKMDFPRFPTKSII